MVYNSSLLVPLLQLTERALAPGSLGFSANVGQDCDKHALTPQKLLWLTGVVQPGCVTVDCRDERVRKLSALRASHAVYNVREGGITEVHGGQDVVEGDLLAVFRGCSCSVTPFKFANTCVARLTTSCVLAGARLDRPSTPFFPSVNPSGVWVLQDSMSRPVTVEELVPSDWLYSYDMITGQLVPPMQYRETRNGEVVLAPRHGGVTHRYFEETIGSRFMLFRTRNT